MRKYKNPLISLGFYLLTLFVMYVVPIFIWPSYDPAPLILRIPFTILTILLVITGLVFAYKSNREQKNLLAAHFVGVLWILTILFYFLVGAGLMV